MVSFAPIASLFDSKVKNNEEERICMRSCFNNHESIAHTVQMFVNKECPI